MQLLHSLIITMLASGCLLPAQEDEAQRQPTLTVSGDAEVAVDPDRAVVSLGATVQAAEAAAAQQQVSQIMQRTITALEEAGVPAESIQTAGLSLQPVYSRSSWSSSSEQEARKVVAYRASNVVRVEVDDPSLLGKVIDAGIGAGANELQGISFGLKDDTPQRAEALRRAVASARQKAEALAEAARVELLAVQHVQEGGVQIATRSYRWAEAALQASTPVQPGQVRVSASVTLEYRIGPKKE